MIPFKVHNYRTQTKLKTEENKMETLKTTAQAYQPPQQMKNIADIDKVPVDIELHDGEGKNSENETFKYKFAKIGEESVRVPGSVIGQLKEILKKMPDLKYITVTKQGTGMNTKYIVMPYQTTTVEEKVGA